MIDKSRFLVYHPQDQAYQAEWRVETFLVFRMAMGCDFGHASDLTSLKRQPQPTSRHLMML